MVNYELIASFFSVVVVLVVLLVVVAVLVMLAVLLVIVVVVISSIVGSSSSSSVSIVKSFGQYQDINGHFRTININGHQSVEVRTFFGRRRWSLAHA